MSYKTKLKIGEFSKMMQVTVKTLRHYEQKGLMLPNEVDEWTGYRYYSIDQIQKHVGPYERFYDSFIEAFRYMEEQDYKIAGQSRTSYIDGAWNQDNPEKWLSVIQIPIE
jgi:hypothetical protein